MTPVVKPFVKLLIYTTVVAAATAVLVAVIINARTGNTTQYSAMFTNVSGLTADDNVKIAGVAVGKITDVSVVGKGMAQVGFAVDRDITVPSDVKATIRYQNLIGDQYLDLQRPTGRGAQALAPDSVIPASQTKPALNLTVLFGGFRPLFQALQPDQVNALADEILTTLQGQGGTVESLLQHTASLTNTIADRDHVIGSLVDDLNEVLATVSTRDAQLSDLLVQLQRFITGLSQDRRTIGSSIEAIGDFTESVSGLLEDARPPLRNDIRQLGALATVLDEGKGTVDRQLKVVPPLLNRVDRTASYGSWFQFYLCDLGGSLIANGQRVPITPYMNTQRRCSPE